MSNITKKSLDELSLNSQLIVNKFDTMLDGGPLPFPILYIKASVEEIVDSTKYIIDTGWLNDNLYIRKIYFTNTIGEQDEGLCFSDDEREFDYIEKNGYYKINKDCPEIIGRPRYNVNYPSILNHFYDGDVNLKLKDGNEISIAEWKQIKQKTYTR